MQKKIKISIVVLLAALTLTACSEKGTDTKIATESKDTAINKDQSFQEASDFVEAYNDTASKLGVFTASNGDMYEILWTENDLITVGPLVENYEQLLAQRQQTDSEQEAIAFVKEINALAAFTIAPDAADLALEAIEDMGMGSYSNGVFTASNGTNYQISFDGDTATVGSIVEGSGQRPTKGLEDTTAQQQARLSVEVARSLLYEYGDFAKATVAQLKKDEPGFDWGATASTPSGVGNEKIVSINVTKANTEFVAAVRGETTDGLNYNCWFVKISKSEADKYAVDKRTENNCIASTPPTAAAFKDFNFPPAP